MFEYNDESRYNKFHDKIRTLKGEDVYTLVKRKRNTIIEVDDNYVTVERGESHRREQIPLRSGLDASPWNWGLWENYYTLHKYRYLSLSKSKNNEGNGHGRVVVVAIIEKAVHDEVCVVGGELRLRKTFSTSDAGTPVGRLIIKRDAYTELETELDDSICDRLWRFEKEGWRGKRQNMISSWRTLMAEIFDSFLKSKGY